MRGRNGSWSLINPPLFCPTNLFWLIYELSTSNAQEKSLCIIIRLCQLWTLPTKYNVTEKNFVPEKRKETKRNNSLTFLKCISYCLVTLQPNFGQKELMLFAYISVVVYIARWFLSKLPSSIHLKTRQFPLAVIDVYRRFADAGRDSRRSLPFFELVVKITRNLAVWSKYLWSAARYIRFYLFLDHWIDLSYYLSIYWFCWSVVEEPLLTSVIHWNSCYIFLSLLSSFGMEGRKPSSFTDSFHPIRRIRQEILSNANFCTWSRV